MELKDIGDRIPLPPVQRPLMEFLKWVSNYNIMPIGMVLKMVLGGVIAAKSCMFGTQEYKRCVPTGDGHGLSASAELSGEQLKACDQIVGRLSGFSVTVLDGKTGSGKTEVYCTAIAKLLHSCLDAQILILLPEIVLATQLMKRVHNYFAGYNPVEWHSGLTAKKRRENWLAITYGASSIVVGARSALFLPFKNLKLIVVDEEHESSFKQDCGIIYNARDMSIVLAKQLGVPVVLCSATPALETMHNVHQGKYHHVVLKQRFGEAVMPDIAVVDMRKDQLLREWLSSGLHDKIASTLAKGNQAMLFLNRRGYARLLRGASAMSGLYKTQYHDAVWWGVERVAEGIKELVPKAKVAIISSDVSTKRITRAIEQIMEGEVNVIVGTQIIAKGHNFPKLTLVGVIDADLGMGNSDLATEKTEKPINYCTRSLVALADLKKKGSAELHSRKVTDMPPYTRLVAIIVSGKEEFRVVDVSKDIVADLSRHITVWGPAPAPMSLVNGVHRYRMLIKTRSIMAVRKILAECRDRYTKLGRVKVVIDVDPVNFA
ncbi:hypothetical protein GH714_042793 [Hevea brasiliensis]|uniref:DNA 3'-5' helicase n=1 Tax=Hevea brasiliensis TaxID=3981 RepID=A0A6A6K3J4_HEVBR|nr:hypothetical protein GH714_042793 [Hevea brasiliensis]